MMRRAILLSSPDPRYFFPHPPYDVVLSCPRSRLFNTLFFHFALSYFLYLFCSFIMKIKVPLFFLHAFCYSKHSIRESGRRARYTSLAFAVNRDLSYSRANQDGVLDVPTLSHLSLYILSSFPLLFSYTSSSLFRDPGASDQMEFFHFIFPTLRTDIKFHRSCFCPCAVFHVHTRTFPSSLELSVKPNLHGLLRMIIPSELYYINWKMM